METATQAARQGLGTCITAAEFYVSFAGTGNQARRYPHRGPSWRTVSHYGKLIAVATMARAQDGARVA
eukprot:5493945-Pyramimonas_sp.AAC.1